MKYDELSQNDRFFLNQLIPKWESGKPFDLNSDLKYVFHREKGTNINPAQFEYTLKTISAFLSDHGFAKENPAKKYTFNLLPKGNGLMVRGTIEQFEYHQDQHRAMGRTEPSPAAPPPPAREPATSRPRPEVFVHHEHGGPPQHKSSLTRTLFLLAVLAAIIYYFIKSAE